MAALSGRLSQLGVSSREALKITTELKNRTGGIKGRRIELLFADDKSLPEVGISEIERLVNEGAQVIIGPLTSNMLPAVQRLDGRGVLVFSPTISTAELSGQDDHFLRVMPATDEQGRILSALMIRDGIRSAAVVLDVSNAQYTEDVQGALESFYTQAGGTIVVRLPYDSKADPDFEGMMQDIRASGAEAVVMICSAIDAAALAQQHRKQGGTLGLYGSRWTKTDDILEYGGRAVEGMTLVSGYFEGATAEAREFRELFFERLGYEPGFAAIYTYETAMIVFTALERAERPDLESLKNEIVDRAHRGYGGDFYIDQYGDTRREDAYSVINEGRFQVRKLVSE